METKEEFDTNAKFENELWEKFRILMTEDYLYEEVIIQ